MTKKIIKNLKEKNQALVQEINRKKLQKEITQKSQTHSFPLEKTKPPTLFCFEEPSHKILNNNRYTFLESRMRIDCSLFIKYIKSFQQCAYQNYVLVFQVLKKRVTEFFKNEFEVFLKDQKSRFI